MSKKHNPSSRIEKRVTKKKLRKRVYFVLIPLIFFVAIGLYVGNIYFKADKVFSDAYVEDGKEKSDLRETVVNPKHDNVSILIMGVDASDIRANANNSRTDTLMVATLNQDDKSVKLVSIPRDTLVYIPEVGYEDKINHAHAFGGTKATVEAVENLLEIPIDYYVKVNFEAFIDVVDAINGITVDVPYELYEQDSNDIAGAIHLLPGIQELNGEEALALARTRKLDNDIERGKRQQEIIKAIVKKSVSLNSLFKVDDIIEAVGTNMSTNMSFKEMKSFVSYGMNGTNIDIEALTLEGSNYKPGKVYYYKLDDFALEETIKTLQDHLEINTSTVLNRTETLENANQY